MTVKPGLLISLLCSLLFALPAAAGKERLFAEFDSGQPVGRHLQSWVESPRLAPGQQPPADADWQDETSDVPNYGLATRPVWFRLDAFSRDETNDVMAVIDLPLLDQIDVYIYYKDRLRSHYRLGDQQPFSQRLLRTRSFAFALDHYQPGQYEFLFRVETNGSLQFPLSFWHDEDFHAHTTNDYIILGIYLGFIASVALYNLFIFFTTRERYALAFVGHVVGYLAFLVALTGLGFQYLWPDNLWLQERSTTIFAAVSAIFACLFARDFLQLRNRRPRLLLQINNITLLIALSILLTSLFMDYRTSVEAAIGGTLMLCLLTLVTGVVAANQNSPSTLLYIAGWVGVVTGVIVHSLTKQGLLPFTSWSSNASHLGSVWMVTMHSLGIALRFHEARINHMQTEQRMFEAQRDTLKARFQVQEAELRRKQTEAENQAKSAFLATMSHEIRTPLNGVLGMVQLLSSTDLDAQQKRWLDTISSSGESLLTVVNDILDLSKMASGHLQLDIQDVNLHDRIHDSIHLYANQARQKGLHIIANMLPPMHSHVRTDPTRLSQILNNLLSNAIKFTERGHVLVSADTRNGQLELRVRDTGIGIPAAFRERVFQHFSQAEASTSRTYGGTGLGLSICRQLATLLGGSIDYHSEEGKGTEFCVLLPDCQPSQPLNLPPAQGQSFRLQLSDEAEAGVVRHCLTTLGYQESANDDVALLIGEQQPPADIRAGRCLCLVDEPSVHFPVQQQLLRPLSTAELVTELNGIRTAVSDAAGPQQPLPKSLIWIAEDNAVNQKVISGMLRQLQLPHRLFTDGEQICEAWAMESQHPDLILMDCEMPVMDGFDATRWLRQQEQNSHQRVPVIALSAHVLAEYKEKASSAGFDDFLEKPIDRALLRQTLSEWLGKTPCGGRPE